MEKCTEVAFEAFPCTVQCSVNKLFDTHTVRVGYQSLVDPESVVDVDLNTLEKVVRKQKQVLLRVQQAPEEFQSGWHRAHALPMLPLRLLFIALAFVLGAAIQIP